MTSKLVIRAHQPWKTRVKIALLVLVGLLLAWGLFTYGRLHAGAEHQRLVAEHDAREGRLAVILEKNEELREEIAVLQRSAQIDKQAYNDVNVVLTDLQDELLELKEELAFYRGIVSPADTASGLTITRFALERGDGEGLYRFKLVLSRVKQNERVIEGRVGISIEGTQDGEPRTLGLAELSGSKTQDMALRFRYFQNIEGAIVLPKGFIASRLIVDIVPVGKNLARIKKPYEWKELTG